MPGVYVAFWKVNNLEGHMEIEHRETLTEDEITEWSSFLSRAEHQHPRQDIRFADVERTEGKHVLFATGRKNGQLRAIGLFSLIPHPWLRDTFAEALCLSGPVCDSAEELVEFMGAVSRVPILRQTGRIRITPYWLGEESKLLHDVFATAGWKVSDPEPFRKTGWVDISPSPDELLASFSKSARREVRRAHRQKIQLVIVREETVAVEFLESLNRLRRQRGISEIPKSGFISGFRKIYRSGVTGVILAAFHESRFVSGLLLYRSRNVAHGRQFTTEPEILRELGNLRISPFLWLEGMKWAKSQGCKILDVEGYEEEYRVDNKMNNINKYKSEFQPKPTIRTAEHEWISNHFLNMTGNGTEILKSYLRNSISDTWKSRFRAFKIA